jgi:signal transduction histidine kinase
VFSLIAHSGDVGARAKLASSSQCWCNPHMRTQADEDDAPRVPLATWGRRVGDRVAPDDRERLDRLAELARHAVAAREEERRRLAAELHDVVGTNLAAIKLTLSSLAGAIPRDSTERLEDAQQLLSETIAGIRDLCGALRPATLEYAGFVAALEAHCARFSHRTGIEVECDLSRYQAPRARPIELMLLRVAQEALWNSSKHAAARRVRISFDCIGSRSRLTIHDDGCGFDPAATGSAGRAPGLGILNMRERALSAGAVFSLDSAPGRGTRVAIDF